LTIVLLPAAHRGSFKGESIGLNFAIKLFTLFRVYGPLEPWFDKSWKPGEIELVK
jgi:hypothetical protein